MTYHANSSFTFAIPHILIDRRRLIGGNRAGCSIVANQVAITRPKLAPLSNEKLLKCGVQMADRAKHVSPGFSLAISDGNQPRCTDVKIR